MKKRWLLPAALLLCLFCRCSSDAPDVSNISVDIQLKRFERDLFRFKADSSAFYLDLYRKKYGEFFKLFNTQIMTFGPSEAPEYPGRVKEFLSFWNNENLPRILEKEFSDFQQKQLPDLEQAFRYYKYYFPQKPIPDIYTFFASFGYSIVALDSVICIGLDKYLGKKYDTFYTKSGYSNYQKRRMTREMLPTDVMRSAIESEFPYNSEEQNDLLHHMLYEGKIQYALKKVLPHTADSLLWRYTHAQMQWAGKHEDKVWNYIAEHKLLFSTEQREIRKFIADGPYTSLFSNNSAPRIGAYIGYKIIQKYMKNKPELPLEQLMQNQDAVQILSEAKYNP